MGALPAISWQYAKPKAEMRRLSEIIRLSHKSLMRRRHYLPTRVALLPRGSASARRPAQRHINGNMREPMVTRGATWWLRVLALASIESWRNRNDVAISAAKTCGDGLEIMRYSREKERSGGGKIVSNGERNRACHRCHFIEGRRRHLGKYSRFDGVLVIAVAFWRCNKAFLFVTVAASDVMMVLAAHSSEIGIDCAPSRRRYRRWHCLGRKQKQAGNALLGIFAAAIACEEAPLKLVNKLAKSFPFHATR